MLIFTNILRFWLCKSLELVSVCVGLFGVCVQFGAGYPVDCQSSLLDDIISTEQVS